MENKEIKITPPEGYEIDVECSTFDCIKFKPIKKNLTYKDICKFLFKEGNIYFVNNRGEIEEQSVEQTPTCILCDLNNFTSRKQAEKLLAVNKLMNVAKYLNGDWRPNWKDDNERKWYIYIDIEQDKIDTDAQDVNNENICYFKSNKLALQAIEILGRDTVRLALSTDW